MLNSLIFIICMIYVRRMFCLLYLSRTHWMRSTGYDRLIWNISSCLAHWFDLIRCGSLAGKCVFTLINLTRLLLWHVNKYAYDAEWYIIWWKIHYYGWRNFVANIIECDAMQGMALTLSLSVYSSADCILLFIGKSAWRDHSQMLPLFRHTHKYTDTLAHTALKSTDWLTGWLTENAMHVFYHRLKRYRYFPKYLFFVFFSVVTKSSFKILHFVSISRRTYQFPKNFCILPCGL